MIGLDPVIFIGCLLTGIASFVSSVRVEMAGHDGVGKSIISALVLAHMGFDRATSAPHRTRKRCNPSQQESIAMAASSAVVTWLQHILDVKIQGGCYYS